MPDIRKVFSSRAIDPELLTGAERLLYEGFQRRQQTNLTVQRMAGDGVPIKQIVRMTGLSRNLVRQILRGEREDAFRLRESSLEPWLPGSQGNGKAVAGMVPSCGAGFAQRGSEEACASSANGRHDSGAPK